MDFSKLKSHFISLKRDMRIPISVFTTSHRRYYYNSLIKVVIKTSSASNFDKLPIYFQNTYGCVS